MMMMMMMMMMMEERERELVYLQIWGDMWKHVIQGHVREFNSRAKLNDGIFKILIDLKHCQRGIN